MSAQNEEILDCPVDWVAKHIRTYVESGGEKGHKYSGRDSLLLTTRGRKSGKLRRTALFYGRDGDRYVLVASNGGKAQHPQWYLNLLVEPEVQVQVGTESFGARARPAADEEKPPLWEMMVGIMSHYEAFQKKTSREIPVVVVERSGESGGTP
jgi:deazaflavin-dependent oxidoreductase (nitroreductase family)